MAVEVIVVGKNHSRVEKNEEGVNERTSHKPGTILMVSEREQQVFSHRLHLVNPPKPEVGENDGDAPPDDTDLPDGVTVEEAGGTWFLVCTPDEPDGVKVNGKKALREFIEELHRAD